MGNTTTATLSNLTPGTTYYIATTAYNSSGLESLPSNEVVYTAAVNQVPSVVLTSPANGAQFTAPASITLNANASDPDGTIARVEFYNGSTKLGQATAAPTPLHGVASRVEAIQSQQSRSIIPALPLKALQLT